MNKSLKLKKIVLTGGGTGGHIYPHLALLDDIRTHFTPIYIGSKSGMEKEMMEKCMPYYGVTNAKFRRSCDIKNLLIPFALLKGIFEAKKILSKEKPHIVFSKGGFVAVPVVLAASLLRIPVVTHESDITLGLANRLIKNKCKAVCTSFETTAQKLKNGVYTGSPVRKQILSGNGKKVVEQHHLDPLKQTVLIFGGSLGSRAINEEIWNDAKGLVKQYNILHIVGKHNLNQKIKFTNYVQMEYANNIEDYFSAADVVITRGGSNALWELFAIQKPMLIIPLGKAESRGDQILNAEYFKTNGYATVLNEDNMNPTTLKYCIHQTLLHKTAFQKKMANRFVNGTQKIMDQILKYAKK